MSSSMSLDSGTESLGPYRLLALLGRGGMGEVHLASHESAPGVVRQVAVKRIKPELAGGEEHVQLFMDEVRIAMRLSHPHIAHTYDFGVADGQPYIAFEYVDGPSLYQILKRCERPPVGVALRIACSIASALAYAHRLRDEHGQPLRIVHRDVSPHNVIVARDGTAKLIDFGIAKARSQLHQTHVGTVKGKCEYMAPEQVQDGQLGPWTDIFALSIVLWEMLAGRRLFRFDNGTDAMLAICGDERPTLAGTGVDAELAAIVARGLAKRPGDRWPDAESLGLALEQYLSARGLPASHFHVGQFVRSLEPDASDARTAPERGRLDGLIRGAFADGEPEVRVVTAREAPILEPRDGSGDTTAPVPRVEDPGLPGSRGDGRDFCPASETAVERADPESHRTVPAKRSARRRWPLAALAVAFATGLMAVLLAWASAPSVRRARDASRTVVESPAPPRVSASPQVWVPPPPSGPRVHATPPRGRAAVAGPGSADSASPSRTADLREAGGSKRGRRRSEDPDLAAAVPEGAGQLWLRTEPPTRAYLGDRLLGRTPLRNLELAPGRHVLRFVLDDGSDAVTRVVTVSGEGPTHLSFYLSPSVPAAAAVGAQITIPTREKARRNVSELPSPASRSARPP